MIRRTLGLLLLLLAGASPAFPQGTIIPFVTQTFVDTAGNPVNNGKLCSYAAGTTTPLATYSDVTLMTANANPTRTSSNGRPTTGAIYLTAAAYKFELHTAGTDNTCATGTVLWTLDNVTAIPTTSGNLDITGTAGETLAAGEVAYISDGSGALNAGRFYKADADFTYASSFAGMVGIATTAIASGNTGTIRLAGQFAGLSGLTAGLTYYVSATAGTLTATAPTNTRVVGQAVSTTTIDFAANPRPIVTQPLGVAEGRLTCTTATPVTTTDCTGVTSIFYAPYIGNRIALFDGTSLWIERTFSEITISVSACTASKPYDVFLYDNAGTVTAETLVWTNATTRATALVSQDGVLVKSGVTTRRYVGSFYCNASGGQTDDSFTKRYLWNYYNRETRLLFKSYGANTSWTYTTATWRQAAGSAANQVEVMIGVAEVAARVNNRVISTNTNANVARQIGIGVDVTNTNTTGVFSNAVDAYPATQASPHSASYVGYPAVGYHFFAATEYSGAIGTTTWNTNLNSIDYGGIYGEIDG